MHRGKNDPEAPLEHAEQRLSLSVTGTGGGLVVHAAPLYVIFIEGRYNGKVQQVSVEPSDIDALVEALQRAKAFQGDVPAPQEPAGAGGEGHTSNEVAAGLGGPK